MRVGVVGGGVTGLAVTHHLAERDTDVVAFEAGREPGGVVRSRRVDGRVLEYGPQRIRLVPAVADLVTELGLEAELIEADDDLPLYVYADGRLGEVPKSLEAFVRTDLLSDAGKARVLREPLTEPASPDERAADLFDRKFGTEAYRTLVEPLFGGIYGSDPAEMPAEHSLAPLFRLEQRHGSLLRAAIERLGRDDGEAKPPVSFADGLQALPEALYEAHRPYVHLNTPVQSIRRADDGDEREGDGAAGNHGDARYVLETGGRDVEVDAVVVTAPAPPTASLFEGLDGATVDPLRELTYNSLVLVHLLAETDASGFGYQVRRDEGLETLGVTWNDALFGRDGVYTAFLGGMHDPDAIDRPADELGAVARREFREVMGADAEVLDVTKLPNVFPAYDTSWDGLDDVSLPEGVVLETNYTARLGVPTRIRRARRVADGLSGSD